MNMIVILLTTVLSVPPDNLIIPSTLSDIYINRKCNLVYTNITSCLLISVIVSCD